MTFTPTIAEDMYQRADTLGHSILAQSSQFYEDGFWHNTYEATWTQTLNVSALAAGMSAHGSRNNGEYRDMAIRGVERAFERNLYVTPTGYTRFSDGPEGVFDEPTGTDDTTNIEALSAIGSVMYYLDEMIPLATRRRWLVNMKGCLRFLGTLNYPYYYINGNYAMHLAAVYWYVADQCRKTGDHSGFTTYNDLYNVMYNVTINPAGTIPGGSVIWLGYGRTVTVTGSNEDWSNYTGYLSETNGYQGSNPSPKLDYAYSLLQLDLAATLYLHNRDTRFVRLINMIHNTIEPRINSVAWTIDCNGGSRQTGTRGWTNSWMAVVHLIGTRLSNRTLFTDANMRAQWDTQISPNLSQGLGLASIAPSTMRQFNITVATVLEASVWANKEIA